MAETSLPWGGIVTGDAILAPYSDDQWSDAWRKIFQRDRTIQGPIGGMLNGLAATNPAGTTVRINTGIALVDGKLHESTAVVDFDALAANNYYTIVIQKDFTTQEVRLAMLGPNGVAPPGVTQDEGPPPTIWEIAIWTVFNNAGTIELTDVREWAMRPPTQRVFVPAQFAYNFDSVAYIVETPNSAGAAGGFHYVFTAGERCDIAANYLVPNDFLANFKYRPIFVTGTAGANDIYHCYKYVHGICGEAWNIHSQGCAYAAEEISGSQVYYCIGQQTLANITKGDIVGLSWSRDAGDVLDDYNDVILVLGFEVEYDSI